MSISVSVNRHGLNVIKEVINRADELAVRVEENRDGTTLIDMGVEARGGFLAGKYLTDICLGGLGHTELSTVDIGGLVLPSIVVAAGYPSISLLGSQFAGWQIKVGEGENQYFAMGSGPARALPLKPKEIYQDIEYKDSFDSAVIVLETDVKPPEAVTQFIAQKCSVDPKNLYVAFAPTSSVAGSTQISGRIVETGLHKLYKSGFDPKKVRNGLGEAPIAPIHPKSIKAMGRTNDMILYAGRVYFEVEAGSDEELKKIVQATPSSASRDYGKPFYDLFKAADFDFYKIDEHLFAPAVVTINNLKTGHITTAGKVNEKILLQSIGYAD